MPKKPRKDNWRKEEKITNQIFVHQTCGAEIRQWVDLVTHENFATNIKLQNQASLIARGIVLKLRVLKTQDITDDRLLMEIAAAIAREYGQVWERQAISLLVSDPDGGPVQHSLTVKESINTAPIDEAIKRDQEER